MLTKELFQLLTIINQQPKAYEYYTTPELWCDPYISKQMLAMHLSQDTELASRKADFIERSVAWITNYFKLNQQVKLCDFGCGPGLYTTKFAQRGTKVTGIDFSATAISYALAQAKYYNLDIEYILQDYLKFETSNKFDLITMIYCDFCALNPRQRAILLQNFHRCLADDGLILLDVSSLAEYNTKPAIAVYEHVEANGFWSPDPYYVFHHRFKYPKEHLLLDKFSIITQVAVRHSYNWLQCFSVPAIAQELQQHGFEVIDYFANVAGDLYTENATEVAVIARKVDVIAR